MASTSDYRISSGCHLTWFKFWFWCGSAGKRSLLNMLKSSRPRICSQPSSSHSIPRLVLSQQIPRVPARMGWDLGVLLSPNSPLVALIQPLPLVNFNWLIHVEQACPTLYRLWSTPSIIKLAVIYPLLLSFFLGGSDQSYCAFFRGKDQSCWAFFRKRNVL